MNIPNHEGILAVADLRTDRSKNDIGPFIPFLSLWPSG